MYLKETTDRLYYMTYPIHLATLALIRTDTIDTDINPAIMWLGPDRPLEIMIVTNGPYC